MKKLLLGVGICSILGISLFVTAQYWVIVHTLRAIEAATGSRVQMQALSIELLAGRVNLHGVALIPKKESSLIASVTVADASGQMRWKEWSSGVIPMEATLDHCTVILRQENRERFLKEHIQFSNQPAPIISQGSDNIAEPQKTKIVLTALAASNITFLTMGRANLYWPAESIVLLDEGGRAGRANWPQPLSDRSYFHSLTCKLGFPPNPKERVSRNSTAI